MPRVPYSLNSYTGGAPTAALAAAVSITGTSISIVNTSSGWYPLGVSGGFFLALDYGTALEEKIFVPSGAYNWLAGVSTVQTISGITRAQDNTNAVAHVSGSISAFVMTGVDLAEANLAVSQTLGQATTATSGYAYFSNGSGLVPYAIQPGRITGLSAGAIPFGSATGAWSDTSISGGGTGSAGQLLMSYGNIANTGPKWVSFPVHPAVQVVSTTNIAGTYTANGNSTNDAPLLVDTFTVTATGNVTIDGYIVQLGDRILLAGQTTSSQNGIYLCTTFGTTGVSAVFVRDNDADTVGKLAAALVQVRQGALYTGTTWQCQVLPTATIGVSSIPFSQFLGSNNAIINNPTINNGLLTGAKETITINTTALSGITTFSSTSGTVNYYTTAATASFNFNLTSSTTLNLSLPVGQSITFTALTTQGNPAYAVITGTGGATVQIDGVLLASGNTYWQGGTAPASGNVNGIDVYNFTVIKTAATPTYTVLASQTKF